MLIIERADGQMLNLGAAREIYADPGNENNLVAEYSGNMIYVVENFTITDFREHLRMADHYACADWKWMSDRW